ncbi:CD276 antigen-like [Lepisosteus oculatus]|uniref:CD276 antigen-like n=1 Tax=Lepisosteus oculatus TaxID=7918 RepID=UPI0035F51787
MSLLIHCAAHESSRRRRKLDSRVSIDLNQSSTGRAVLMGLFLPLLLTLLHTEALAGTSVWVRVGDGVTLPCDGSRALGIPENELHVIWRTPTKNVWSFEGGRELAGPGYEHRAEVSRDGIGQGNFSLTLRRTQISDSDLYECYYFTGSLQFLGDVELSVTCKSEDRKVQIILHRNTRFPHSTQTGYEGSNICDNSVNIFFHLDLKASLNLKTGASLSVPLFTGEPVEVLFDPAGSGDWTSVCSVQNSTASCVPQYRDRVSVDNQELRLQELRASDQGSYTVRDLQGNTISTAIVTVEAHRDTVTLQAGASLSVPLLTAEPVEVLFDPAGSGDWTSVCSVQNSTASCVPQYRDRVSVDNQELRLQELRASDQGSYTVRDLQGNTISTAIVTVEAHRDTVTLQAGASLSVPLLTGEPVEVLFDPAGSTRSLRVFLSSAGLPGPGYEQRVWVQDGSLTLRSLTPADQGSYTVRDLQGNTISTVIVTVEETPHRAAHLIPAIVGPSALVIVIAVAVVMWRKHRK